ncbi:hypothetical protein GCM10008014_14900 [Paenibacillus silvae]|uniref:ABC transporter domain-containing protein n=1 Tax=Paenibacillus silvae TaxID=1325358 RepID=A0ABQ1Z4J1_9BACL|nr:ABC transporter ATP-binding protein [Paenibacillus silvae]GGH50045.1 hypothetical protein GCM10008014_14900 [Paenibacillus silvae]
MSTLLEIKGLRLAVREQTLIHDISLSLNVGEWLTIIGESGSGKTLTGLSIGQLLPHEVRHSAGEILLNGMPLQTLSEKEINRLRGKEIGYIFQDYSSVFSPFITIGKQLNETLQEHYSWGRKKRQHRIIQALEDVGLPAQRVIKSYPFQLSGGQLQRVSIATAMMLEPKLLIADEPTSALDGITATDILELLIRLRSNTGCTILFITHDLKLARGYSDQIAIMCKGNILESGETQAVLSHSTHAYTRKLLAAESLLTCTEPEHSIEHVKVGDSS